METPLLVCFLCTLVFTLVISANMGPPGPIKIYEISECDPPLNKISFKASVDTASDNTDSLSMSFTLPEDYDDSLTIRVIAEKFVNGNWKEYYTIDDKQLIPFIRGFGTETWIRMRKEIQPEVKEENRVPAGSYKLENFQASHTELNTPQVCYGRFRSEAILTANGEDTVCIKVECELFEPSVSSMTG